MKSLKVFVVDDDPDFAEGIGLTLELEGHDVTYASSGEEAVQKFAEQEFDVTLMDIRMPGIDGVESLRRILEINPDAKVVMITAYGVEEVLKQAIGDGALRVLQKPVTTNTLVATLREIHRAGVVLVADDDPDFVEGIKNALVAEGYVVETAHTGGEAVKKVLMRDIDVLLLDIKMPDMNGLEVYRNLNMLGRSPPTIVVTGYSVEESEIIHELLRTSVRGVLVKPVASDELLQAVKQAV